MTGLRPSARDRDARWWEEFRVGRNPDDPSGHVDEPDWPDLPGPVDVGECPFDVQVALDIARETPRPCVVCGDAVVPGYDTCRACRTAEEAS